MVEAAEYYEKEQTGLGKSFLTHVKKTLEHIRAFPESGVLLENMIRRHSLRRFRYSVIYSIEQDHLYIASIMHQNRRPQHWKDNLEKENN